MTDMYDVLSSDYDRFVNWPQRLAYEIPLVTACLPNGLDGGKAHVLDAACGTGQHTIALAKLGYSAAGADISPEMVHIAKLHAAQTGISSIPFKIAGFGQLQQAFARENTPTQFDALLCLGNSLPHIIDEASLAQALADFHACLRPGGVLLIQNRNFDAVMVNQTRWMEPQAYREEKREWLFIRFYDFEADGLIRFNILTLTREGAGTWQQRHTHTRLMPQRMRMLVRAIESAGFRVQRQMGDLSGSPFNPESSTNAVILAEKQ